MNSERWRWCSGCGKWHDSSKPQLTHFLMSCSYQEPCERNFEGTAEDLQRFLLARQLRAEDAAAFERRIDERIAAR